MRLLRIYRGVPGSGKSTAAHRWTSFVAEADKCPGRYLSNMELNPDVDHQQAQDFCRQMLEGWMQQGIENVAVANTFLKRKYCDEYIAMAKKYLYQVEVVDCDGGYESIHCVPEEKIQEMKSRWEDW